MNQIYVINLDKDKERLSQMKNQNISFKRFPAVNGKKMSSEQLKKLTTLSCRTLLCSRGMIGCYQSHIQLWKQLIKDQSVDYYTILEDDAVTQSDFNQTLNEIIQSGIDFDLINFFCNGGVKLNCYSGSKIRINQKYSLGKAFFPLSTVGYIISKKGAKSLLDILGRKTTYHVDFQIALHKFNRDDLNIYNLYPYLVRPNWTMESNVQSLDNYALLLQLGRFLNLDMFVSIANTVLLTFMTKFNLTWYGLLLIILMILFSHHWIVVSILGVELLLHQINSSKLKSLGLK